MRVTTVLAVCAVGALFAGCDVGGGTATGTFDATGQWSGLYAEGGSTSSFTAQVTQTGGSITGTISIPLIGLSDTPLTGSVNGYAIQFGDIARTISFSGTAQPDDTAAGTYSIASNGSSYAGTWTGSCTRSLTLVRTVTVPSGAGGGKGLAWDGSHLWVSSSQMLSMLSTDGALLTSYRYDGQQFPYHDFGSLTVDGSSIWATEENTGPGNDQARLYRISTSDGSISSSIPAPPDGSATNTSPVGLGLAWDGSSLWCLRYTGSSETIYKVDRDTGAVMTSFPAPADSHGSTIMVGGFAAAGAGLWISDRAGYLYYLRSSDGHIMHRFDLSASLGGPTGATPAGVAWDGRYLWVRAMYADSIYGFTIPSNLMQ